MIDHKFSKKYGQNFIFDEQLLRQIVADSGVCKTDCVLEVGAGAGTLTRALCSAAGKVVALEIDLRLKETLFSALSGVSNVSVEFCDVMKLSPAQIAALFDGKPFKVVANIPYYVTTPLITMLLESGLPVTSMTLTVQKEVALRLAAKPGTKDYGALSVAAQSAARVEIVRYIPRTAFYPVPNVDSAVVRMDIDRSLYNIKDAALLRKTVSCAFAMRRKTLVNNLTATFGVSRTAAEKAVEFLGKDKAVRGEQLSVSDFVSLADYVAKNADFSARTT